MTKKIFTRVISLLLSTAMLLGTFTTIFAAQSVKYSYTIFALDSVILDTPGFNLNGSGNIAANGTITSPTQSSKLIENVGESMIHIGNKIESTYFSGNVDTYDTDYSQSGTNININNPIQVNGNLTLGDGYSNINPGSGLAIMATGNISLLCNTINANNNIIYSEQGNILIEFPGTASLQGLIYAPHGDVTITAQGANLNGVVIIARNVTINSQNTANINYSDSIAEFIGMESEVCVLCNGDNDDNNGCGVGGIIAPPTTEGTPGIRIINGNALEGTSGNSANRRVLEVDILDLVNGTCIKANDVYGIEAVTWGDKGNRQVYIDVRTSGNSWVASPQFHGSSTADADKLWAIMVDENENESYPTAGTTDSGRKQINKLVYMNRYGGTPKVAGNLVTLSPFVNTETPEKFDVRIRANNDGGIGHCVTSFALLGADGELLGQSFYSTQDENGDWSAFSPYCECCKDCGKNPCECPLPCRYGGVIVTPINEGTTGVRVINGNALEGTSGNAANRRVLQVDVLELIANTPIKANDIYGIEALTFGDKGNRQVYIDVRTSGNSWIASPQFHGSATADVDKLWAIMVDENGNENYPSAGTTDSGRKQINKLVYMNQYGGSPKVAGNLVTLAPFADTETPEKFDVRIRANNDGGIGHCVTSFALLDENGDVLGIATYSTQDDNGVWGNFESFVPECICGVCEILNPKEKELERIFAINEDSYFPVEVLSDENELVYSIDGKFSNVLAINDDSALNSLKDVKALLEITNISEEIKHSNTFVNHDIGYKSYLFDQFYNGINVFGRTITVVARDNGETLSLNSGYYPISEINTSPAVSADTVKTNFDVDNAELIIYSFDEFKENPILAYFCSNRDENLIVSAVSGELITSWSNITENNSGLPYGGVGLDDITLYSHQNCLTNCQPDCQGSIIYTRDDELLGVWDNQAIIEIQELELGVDFSEPNNELVFADEQQTATRYIYHYDQIYNGLKVYGRTVSVTVNRINAEEILFFHSNILNLGNFDFNVTAIETEETNIKTLYSDWVLEEDDPVIYSWDGNPVVVYVFLDVEGNRTYYVDALNGDIINENNLEHQLGKGLGEGRFRLDDNGNYYAEPRQLQYFPVNYTDINTYEMSTPRAKCITGCVECTNADDCAIEVNHNCSEECPGIGLGVIEGRLYNENNAISSENSYFYEPEAVSAYLNAIRTCKWYAENLRHHRYVSSIGYVSVGQFIYYLNNSKIKLNDLIFYVGQYWDYTNALSYPLYVSFTETYDQPYGYSMDSDVFAHEFQHGVFDTFGHLITSDWYVGAGIHEGYADVFANLVNYFDSENENWIMSDSSSGSSPMRIGSNPPEFSINFESAEFARIPENPSAPYDCHDYIPFVMYPTYLMHDNDNGISIEELKHLYYSSLIMGIYNNESNMNSVRINVIKAAKIMWNEDVSEELLKIQKVIDAFNEIWEWDINTNEVKYVQIGDNLYTTNSFGLDLSGLGLTDEDIEPLKHMTNLHWLYLYDNEISDISCLSGLTKLGSLKLSNNKISDISSLSGLTNLYELDLSNNLINDLNPLIDLTYLNRLYLSNNLIDNLNPLSDMTNLIWLFLSNNQITDLSCLEDLSILLWLKLEDNPIYLEDVEDLQGYLTNCYIEHTAESINIIIGGVPYNRLSTELDLSNKGLTSTDLGQIGAFINLSVLNLSGNQIDDLSPLYVLNGLAELDLSDNPICIKHIEALQIALPNCDITHNAVTAECNDINCTICRPRLPLCPSCNGEYTCFEIKVTSDSIEGASAILCTNNNNSDLKILYKDCEICNGACQGHDYDPNDLTITIISIGDVYDNVDDLLDAILKFFRP